MKLKESMPKKDSDAAAQYPFSLPVLQSLGDVVFTSPVCFFVGENGSGKSSLMEAIAVGLEAVSVGSSTLESDHSLDAIRTLASHIRFIKNRKPRRGFFLRAEDFFGFVKRIKSEVVEYQTLEKEFEQRYTGTGKQRAVGMARGQTQALVNRYGADADAFSHGESFLRLFQSRIVPQGLYILDEPEAPLSPLRQLALLSLIKEMVAQSCQFIIATHSPILMAFPKAQILCFDQGRIRHVDYEEVEHVAITKAFLNDPESYLRRI